MTARILLADDNTDMLQAFHLHLQTIGYEVDAVAGGEAALEAYTVARHDRRPYDLLLIDLAMPFTSGFAVVEKIRGSGDDKTKIGFLTGYDPEDIGHKDILGAAAGVLRKPIDVDTLENEVERMLKLDQSANQTP